MNPTSIRCLEERANMVLKSLDWSIAAAHWSKKALQPWHAVPFTFARVGARTSTQHHSGVL
jgi:hypothetical protein